MCVCVLLGTPIKHITLQDSTTKGKHSHKATSLRYVQIKLLGKFINRKSLKSQDSLHRTVFETVLFLPQTLSNNT